MDNITISQIRDILKFIVEFVGLLVTIVVAIKKVLEKQLKSINGKVDNLDLNNCKNFLVRFLSDIERNQRIDEVEFKRAHDVYDHYKDDLHGNSTLKISGKS